MHARRWSRAVGAVALTVVGACGGVVLVSPPRSGTGPSSASLASRSNGVLATALPTSADFPAGWGYSVTGQLRRETAPNGPGAKRASARPSPAADYLPAACGAVPKIVDQSSGAALAASVQIHRDTQIWAQDAAPPDAGATGEGREYGPNARFAIWVVPDPAARIAEYQYWLGRCASYRVINYDYAGEATNERAVTTVVEASAARGAEAGVAVTRSFTTVSSHEPPSTYHVEYYALRGVLLECSVNMEGADADIVKAVAARTLRNLQAM
jgi:hypothetical protein